MLGRAPSFQSRGKESVDAALHPLSTWLSKFNRGFILPGSVRIASTYINSVGLNWKTISAGVISSRDGGREKIRDFKAVGGEMK